MEQGSTGMNYHQSETQLAGTTVEPYTLTDFLEFPLQSPFYPAHCVFPKIRDASVKL